MAVHWRRSDGLASRMPPTDPKKRPPFSPSRISPAAPRRRPLPATISGAAWSVPTKPGSGWMATPPPLCCSPDSATARRCGGRDGGTGKRASGFCLRSAWLRRQSGQRGTARSLHRCRRTARPAPNCRPATALRAGAGKTLITSFSTSPQAQGRNKPRFAQPQQSKCRSVPHRINQQPWRNVCNDRITKILTL